MLIGYARVSSLEQRLEVQLEKLQRYGCDRIYQEKQSGTTDQRPQLQACLDFVRKDDTLVVTKLDRLARSMAHLWAIDTLLKKKEVMLKVLDQEIDTTTSHGQMLFGMLAVFAQFENDLRKERQMDGIKKAQASGVQFGRTHTLTPAQVARLHQQRTEGVLIRELMQQYRLTKSSIYRYLAQGHPDDAQAAD
jgi:DNA invertase Pin-like site-specific DNA recombinase